MMWKTNLKPWASILSGLRVDVSKPFLKWAGGKTKLVPFIDKCLPHKRKRLIEPFAGSSALSLALDFEEYYLNDVNYDLISTYQNIKKYGYEFIDYAKSFFIDNNNQESQFYQLRERFNHTDDDIEKSALFIYLNRHAFNGLCRYNSKGFFNVPFGRYKKPYFPENEMLGFLSKSSRIRLFNQDYQLMFDDLYCDDIIYCDPPYVPLSQTSSFVAYAQNGFDYQEQINLAQLAESNCHRVQMIIASNHDTKQTRELYKNADIQSVLVQRSIAAKGSSRQKIAELLVIYGGNQ